MSSESYQTPILLLVFNRPDFVLKQIAHLRAIKPQYLYVSGDGPRPHKSADSKDCQAVQAAFKTIDWPCELHTHFNASNQGCKIGVSEGINWFFSQVEAGIILEDDCFADLTFFSFASELLARYQHDPQIMHISGAHFLQSPQIKDSYFFSQLPHCWGWATWKRAWKHYELNMESWPDGGQELVQKQFSKNRTRRYWHTIFTQMYQQKIDTWDYQWIYSIWKNYGLSITPAHNLVTNIGFDARATHTTFAFSPLAFKPIKPLSWPLQHPHAIAVREDLDEQTQAGFDAPLPLKVLTGLSRLITRKI